MDRENIMRILFITNSDINDHAFGGGKGAKSRYELIRKIGKTDICIIKKRSSFLSFISILQGYYPPLTKQEITKVKKICGSREYDIVFLDTSVYGGIAKELKKQFHTLPVFVMFQNCELDYNAVRFIAEKSIKSRIYRRLVKKSEAMTLKYCDYSAAFSERDAARLKKIYGAKTDYILPLFIKDEANPEDLQVYGGSDQYCLLFGPNTPPNAEGVKWFVENVSPYIKIRTLIAGNGMDAMAQQLKRDNVEVAGYVDDIHELYRKACCVCLPQFSGGGMKVKTIEAMMFGKTVFGTSEAFSGYGDDYQEVGYVCNTSEEFIRAVSEFLKSGTQNINIRSREIYEKKYSEKAALQNMRDVLTEITEKRRRG